MSIIIAILTTTVAYSMIKILFHIKTLLLIVWFGCVFVNNPTCKTIARLKCFIKALPISKALPIQ